ncbi:sugar ABC transporter permease [Paenibacillus sp. FSL W8-0186]|uniref:ABC transporter permease n=1 Tax=Paenibacillus woosongensis TaxID=307580 RepID=A0ABQ4MYU4_9BACL|nr:sugar ABC transporter permease [Paenibacillus woosongensis]GIP61079.1 ABC transporter permease [Paenibacillus woosongensis]
MHVGKDSKWMQQLVFIGPAVLIFSLVIIAPFLLGLYYSMTDWNGVSPNINWVWFDNFKKIFMEDKDFANSFWFTTKITVTIVILTNLLGFFIAYMLVQKLKTRNMLRSVFFMPNVLGGLLLGFIWQFIFVRGFTTLGAHSDFFLFNLAWLGTEATAFWGLVIVSVWQGTGYVMVIYIAGLSNVPEDLKEAAYVDGAKRRQMLRHVILPMIMSSITVCLFWTINHTYKMYDLNYSLTNGGPFRSTESVSMNIYIEAFANNRYGLGTAKAFIFFIAVALITVIQVYLTKRREIRM